ncbi:MAG: hypothetical protein E6J34_12615 [Chloroflexi bacterium]|nr:MAG: hypothetical protein E6J34_12615 [Chloroflexota bacterium]
MQRIQPWHYLIGIFAIFWIIFAAVLMMSNFPFIVVSMALTIVAILSVLVIALAWAFQNDW